MKNAGNGAYLRLVAVVVVLVLVVEVLLPLVMAMVILFTGELKIIVYENEPSEPKYFEFAGVVTESSQLEYAEL